MSGKRVPLARGFFDLMVGNLLYSVMDQKIYPRMVISLQFNELKLDIIKAYFEVRIAIGVIFQSKEIIESIS